MFSKRRIADGLAPLGFFVGWDGDTEIGLVRANLKYGLFELVDASAGWQRGGRPGDLGTAGIAISLNPGRFTSTKGLTEHECLSNWTPTKTRVQALAWENTIVSTAPARLDSFVSASAEPLLARTADARAAVEKYLELVNRDLSVSANIAELTKGASEAELSEARRLSRTEGFILLSERACYDLISLLVARFAGTIEGDKERFWGKCPNKIPELNWRFQLLASRLFPERGWELLEPPKRA